MPVIGSYIVIVDVKLLMSRFMILQMLIKAEHPP